jgi:hypothetical protein
VGANLPFEFLRAVSPSASFRINKVEPQIRPFRCSSAGGKCPDNLSLGRHGDYRKDHLIQGDAPMLEAVLILLLVLAVVGGIDEVIVLLGQDVGGAHGVARQLVLQRVLYQKGFFGVTVEVVAILIS